MQRRPYLGLLAILVSAAAASAAQVPHNFNIERKVPQGATFTAAKGAVFYAEKSLGRLAVFLAEPLPQDPWPIALAPDDELEAATFGKKDRQNTFMCPRKFGEAETKRNLGKVRPSVCFRDSDNDGTFDKAAKAYGLASDNFPTLDNFMDGMSIFGRVTFVEKEEDIAPLRYVTRSVQPNGSEEGIIEIRYDGVAGAKRKFTISFRSADTPTPLYQSTVEEPLDPSGTTRVTFLHPVLNQPEFIVKGEQALVPAMQVALTEATAKSASGTVETVFPEWRWYRHMCRARPPAGAAPPAQEGELKPCQTVTWRAGDALKSATPAANRFSTTTITQGDKKGDD